MKRLGTYSGFTIVELLIVVVVIAILAAITIVSFNGIQNRAYDSTVQNDLKQSFTQFQNFYSLEGRVPFGMGEISSNFTIARASYGGGDNFLIYCWGDDGRMALAGRSRSGNGFAYSNTTGSVRFSTWPGNGNANLCPAAGIPTTTPGYGHQWIGVNGSWHGSFTAGL